MWLHLLQVKSLGTTVSGKWQFSIRTAICFSSSYTSHPTRLHLCCHHPFLVPIISHPGASAASGWAPALAFDLSDPFLRTQAVDTPFSRNTHLVMSPVHSRPTEREWMLTQPLYQGLWASFNHQRDRGSSQCVLWASTLGLAGLHGTWTHSLACVF